MSTQASYDQVADEYVLRIYDELKHKPLDRQLLDQLVLEARGGLICDIGCGPGHVARYLHEQGANVCGIDLSDMMVERARELNPGIEFRQGDMTALDVNGGSFAAIAAFYSLIHISREEMVPVLGELRRVLRPDGLLLAAVHLGDSTLHLDEWWGHPVSVDFHFFGSAEMSAWLEDARFVVTSIIEREPYTLIEHPSRRAYLFAKPTG
jgi:SAM-dependent methyltransferase